MQDTERLVKDLVPVRQIVVTYDGKPVEKKPKRSEQPPDISRVFAPYIPFRGKRDAGGRQASRGGS